VQEVAEAFREAIEQLYEKRAVGIAYDKYFNGQNWSNYSYSESGEDIFANHSVVIVGRDDNYPKDKFDSIFAFQKSSQDDVWLVKNSWKSEENEFSNRRKWELLQGQYKGGENCYQPIDDALRTGYFWLSF
jgi:hypothetical protein